MLITITILAILAGLFLGASNAAMESARKARTKTTISKIHSLLMERWDDYSTRRVDINPSIESSLVNAFGSDQTALGEARQDTRLIALRELMKFEMPDRWSDVIGADINSYPRSTPWNSFPSPEFIATRPAISKAYLRLYTRLNPDSSNGEVLVNQGAECLYMTVMLFTGDGEARTLFSQQDIGDVDGDGAPEFLDGWGRPIQFIRWPAGFVQRSELMSGESETEPDPFDFFNRDNPQASRPAPSSYPYNVNWIASLGNNDAAYRIIPLIYSPGADGITDINASGGYVTAFDPYARDPDPPNEFEFGLPRDDAMDGDDNSIDNIHNHLLDGR